MKFCFECGHKLEQNMKFCPECGCDLKKVNSEDQVNNSNSQNNENDFVLVKGGSFIMGSRWIDNSSPYQPRTLKDFYISKYLVKFDDFIQFCNSNDIEFEEEFDASIYANKDLPAVYVSWVNAIKYCNWLSKRDSLTPFYNLNGDTDLIKYDRDNIERVRYDLKANGYRLPAEAEWEYASFGGHLVTKDNINDRYSGSNDYDQVAICAENSNDHLHPIATKKPNLLGIFDMSGNVWEWCWDKFAYYDDYETNNPFGPEEEEDDEADRVLRGGSWDESEEEANIRNRSNDYTNSEAPSIGFRLVRNIPI